jgi:LTXXQ motif family protein
VHKNPLSRLLVPALLAATIPAATVLAQAPSQSQPEQTRERQDHRLSSDARKRLHEGRQEGHIAEMKEALKLNETQLKLWAPVEQEIRASFAARQELRHEGEQRREQGAAAPSLSDRFDRASQRMTQRAQRMQAFAAAFKPFYEALSDEQKAVAGIVLKDMRGGMRGHGHRWAMEHMGRMHGGPDGEHQPR